MPQTPSPARLGERELLPWSVLPTARDTIQLGQRLGRLLRAGDVVVLVGDLGAGKTTLTQGLADGLRARGPITSPTFVISRIHPSLVGGPALVHADAYRLADAAELDDLDLDATVASSVTVVEWGEGLAEHLDDSHLIVRLVRDPAGAPDVGARQDAAGAAGDEGAVDEPDPRRVRIVGVGPRWADAVPLST